MSLRQQGGPSPPEQQAGHVFQGLPQVNSLSGLVSSALPLQLGHWPSPSLCSWRRLAFAAKVIEADESVRCLWGRP